MMKKILMTVCLLCLLCFAAQAQTEFTALNVGKGDALIIRTEKSCVMIDTGKTENFGAIYRYLTDSDITRLDAVFITHTDKDHIGGIEQLSKRFDIKQWYFSEFYSEIKEKKHPNNKFELGGSYIKASDRIELLDCSFDVLAPAYCDEIDEDNNSLVMMFESGDGKILLTGDMEKGEESELLFSDAELECDIIKVANHGDDDTSSKALMLAASADIAVISTSSVEKEGTPAISVMETLSEAWTDVFVTEDHFAVRATLDKGETACEYVDYPERCNVKLTVEDEDDEYMVLTNDSDTDADISGWYLYSDKGDEMFVIKECTIPANGSVSIGTRSTENYEYELLWNEKDVISDKKEDVIYLFTDYGEKIVY